MKHTTEEFARLFEGPDFAIWLNERLGQRPTLDVYKLGSPVSATATWVIPPEWELTTYHGQRFRGVHPGIDVNRRDNKDHGLPLYAIGNGRITEARKGRGTWGPMVNLKLYGHDYTARYAHCKDFLVDEGDIVQRGDVIATIGTADVWDAHLHLELVVTAFLEQTRWDRWDGTEAKWAKYKHQYANPVTYIAENAWWADAAA